MGSFGRSYRNGMSEEYRMALREMRKQRSKWYRALRTAVIIAAVLAATLLVLCFMVESLRRAPLFKFVFIVFALCIGGAMCLPWITQLDRENRLAKKGERSPAWHRYVIYAFFGLIGVCIALWIVSVFVIGDGILAKMLDPEKNGTDITAGAFVFLRIALILTLQAVAGTVIAVGILRFGKKYMGLRAVMYLAVAYLDVWLSWLIASVTFAGLEAGTVYPVQNTVLWVIAVLAAVGLAAAGGIFYGQVRRKEIELFLKGDIEKLTGGDVELIDARADGRDPSRGRDLDGRLEKLKSLREKDLITEEEYENKRKEILDKM